VSVSIRRRLTLATAALAVGTVAMVLAVVYFATASGLRRSSQNAVREELATLVERWQHDGIQGLVDEVERRSREPGAFAYLLASESETHIAGNVREWPEGDAEQGSGEHVPVQLQRADVWLVKHVQLESVRVGDKRLLVGRDTSRNDALLDALKTASIGGLVLAAVLAVAAGLAVSHNLLGRVETMRAKIAEILRGVRHERVEVSPRGDEFDELARQFNRLLDENDRLVEQVREATNNIAHDLRTPLQRMHARLEAALAAPTTSDETRATLEALSADTHRLLETFNGLLQIARIEGDDLRRHASPVDVASLVDDVVDLYGPLAEEAGIEIRVDVPPGLEVRAERQLLGQALANLIDNAIKYAATGRSIEISAERADDGVHLAVADRGPGIPEADRERVLERLVRLDSSRSVTGTGLGLSFAAAVAHLHGGRIEVQDNDPGLRIVLHLSDPGSDPAGEDAGTDAGA